MFETIIIIIFLFMCVYYKQRLTVSEFSLLSEDFCVCVYGNAEHVLHGESFSYDKGSLLWAKIIITVCICNLCYERGCFKRSVVWTE